jgi:1-acyl-sn-glycerol-3-phosphate acyltransferase
MSEQTTTTTRWFRTLYSIVRPFLGVWHPFLKVTGRENIPESGCLICGNHSALSDPLWVAFALRKRYPLRVMAKKELMDVPVLGALMKKVGVFGVDRGHSDISAIKTALGCLKGGEYLLVFPEGTRMKQGKREPAKTGCAMLATRTDSLVLPVYVPVVKKPFHRLHVVIGQPYRMEFEGRRASQEDLQRLTDEMMDKIYALGENA